MCSTLGEAWYTYGKMRDAEQEKRLAEVEYQKQYQHFDSNHKLREALETRKNKCERVFQAARSDYNKAAQKAEPILRRITEPVPTPVNKTLIEDSVRKVVERELETFPTYREMKEDLGKLERKMKQCLIDVETEVDRQLRDYTRSSDFSRLSDQVKDLTLRGRQMSVSSDNSRDMDHKLGAQAREVENLRQEWSSQQQKQRKEIASLNDRLNTINRQHKEIVAQPTGRTQMAPGTRSEDVAKVKDSLTFI